MGGPQELGHGGQRAVLLAALQGQAAKPGLPVRPVRVPSTALWPRGWQLQPRLHSSTGMGRPMRRRCVAIPWDGAGRRAPGCASPVISPPRHAALLWNRARQQREPGGGRAHSLLLGATVHTQHPCVQSCLHVCVVVAQPCIHCCLQRAPSLCTPMRACCIHCTHKHASWPRVLCAHAC